MSNLDVPPTDQGLTITIVGQVLILCAWFAVVMTTLLDGSDALLPASIGGGGGLILSGIGFLRLRPRLATLGTAAGWVLLGGIALALLVFALVPSGREWGKLAALIFALGVVATCLVTAQLLASLGLARTSRAASWTGVVANATALLAGLLALLLGSEVLYFALASSLVGHIAFLIGLTRPDHPVTPSASP